MVFLGQVWYLIVSISDLCRLFTLNRSHRRLNIAWLTLNGMATFLTLLPADSMPMTLSLSNACSPGIKRLKHKRNSIAIYRYTCMFVWFVALRPSQQLWSCPNGQFTYPHFFPGQARISSWQLLRVYTFICN